MPTVKPTSTTAPVAVDADDPAIWISRDDPGRSLILGTNKVVAPEGSLVAFTLDGRVHDMVPGLDRPNNVDVEYGVRLGARTVDVAVVTERKRNRLRVFRIDPDTRRLEDVSGPTGIPVLAGQAGEAAEPMGIALYKRPRDGAVFAIVSPKTGAATEYLWQSPARGRRQRECPGHARAPVRGIQRHGTGPGGAERIEAVVVDDALGYVYYADEQFAIRKWHADPDHPEATRELAVFGQDGFIGPARRPRAVGPGFPAGALVAMNSTGRNFWLFRWEDVAER